MATQLLKTRLAAFRKSRDCLKEARDAEFKAGMLRAAQMARDEFKRAPNAAKGHDSVYMGGYEDACDHLSIVIAQSAVIDSVRIAGAQPDWQYHISLLLPEGIEDATVLRIYQVVEHELRRAATAAPIAAPTAIQEAQREPCVNCNHVEPHNGPAGAVDDACTHKGCSCGYYQAPPKKCLHCDPSFVPTEPDGWCYCVCHRNDLDTF